MDDSTTIWFAQFHGKEVRLIDYYEQTGEWLQHYVDILTQKWYNYWTHYLPHDAEVRELSTGMSRTDYLRKLWITNTKIVPKLPVQEGIDAVRRTLAYCWFDEEKTEHGVNALINYHKEYDDKNQVFKTNPKHDWSSHGADAFRYLAVSYEQITKVDNSENIVIDMTQFV